jgi:hypothetical protein
MCSPTMALSHKDDKVLFVDLGLGLNEAGLLPPLIFLCEKFRVSAGKRGCFHHRDDRLGTSVRFDPESVR